MPTVLLSSERKAGLLRKKANPGMNCSDEIYWSGGYEEGGIELAFHRMTGEHSGHLV